MNKKKIIVILAGLGLAFGLGYLLFRKPKKDEETESGETSGGETSGGETSGGGTSGGGTSATLPTNPFKTEEEVKRFQSFAKIYSGNPNWIGYPVDAPVYLGTTGDNQNGIDGKWGTRTAQAYKTYGEKFNTKLLINVPEITIQRIKNIVAKAKKDSLYGCKWTENGLKNLYIYYYNDFPFTNNGSKIDTQFNSFLLRFSTALENITEGSYISNPNDNIKNAFSWGARIENKAVIGYKSVIYDAKYCRPIAYNVNDSNYIYNAIANKNNPTIFTSCNPSSQSGEKYKINDRLGKCTGFFVIYTSAGSYYFYRFTNSNMVYRFVSADDINLEVRKTTGSGATLETYPARFTFDGKNPKYHPFKIYM